MRHLVLALSLAAGLATVARADTLLLNHQGRLLDSTDVPVDGQRQLTFRLYDLAQKPLGEDEQPVWSATYEVSVAKGTYGVMLGNTEGQRPALTDAIFPPGKARWLSIQVDGGAELSPRLRVGVVPAALWASKATEAEHAAKAELADRATNADHLEGKALSDLDTRWARLQGATDPAQQGSLKLDGTVSAQAFAGDGAALTGLDARALSAGTVADARLSGPYTQKLSLTNAGNAFSGAFTGALTGDVTGNVTGNLKGNVTGNLTGNVTGDLTGNVTGSLTGTATLDALRLPLSGTSGNCAAAQRGQLSYNTADGGLYVCDGAGWKSASVRAPQLEWAPVKIDFDLLGAATLSATLRNSGDQAIAGLAVNATGGFVVQSGCGTSLAPRSSCAVLVSMPTAGPYASRITGQVTATGTGVTASSLDVAGTTLPAATCKVLRQSGVTADGVYTIDPDGRGPAAPMDVYCDMTTDGGGWTLAAYCGQAAVAGSGLTNLPDLRCGGGGYNGLVRQACAALPSVALARQSTDMGMTSAAGANVVGTMLAYDQAHKIAIPDPASVNFVNHSHYGPATGAGPNDRGPCVQASVTTLKGASVDGARYFFRNSLGVSWQDSYPTGYGVNPNANCEGSWSKGPFFTSVHSGSGHPSSGGQVTNACLTAGNQTYTFHSWYNALTWDITGSVAIWFR